MTPPIPQPEASRAAGPPVEGIAAATMGQMLVDTHVHLYADAVDVMLDAAVKHFAKAARSLGLPNQTVGCLMLTETFRDQAFDELEKRSLQDQWRPDGSVIGAALWVQRNTGQRLLIIAGGQAVTQEGVEVLSLGTREQIADGQPIDSTIEQAVASGALPVLPYGVGKWLGKRGAIVAQAFDRWHMQGVRLGDNAGRPSVLHDPALFTQAKQLGLPVLAGSDPLRTARGKFDAGRYGMSVAIDAGSDDPAASITGALRGLTDHATPFGKRVGLARCLNDQLALRRKKILSF